MPQRFQLLHSDLLLVFQDCMESFRGGALHIDSRGLRILCQSIHSFSLGRCQGWLSKRLDEGSCSFCSTHSFLCNCGDRMERLERHLTSEGCNIFSMAKTSGKAQCAPYYKNTITYSTSVYYYYKSLPSKSLTIILCGGYPFREMHPE